jgi:hypothetical protein
MFGWQPDTLKEWELTWSTSLWVLLVAGIVFLGSSAAALAFAVQMPTTYFRDPPPSVPWAGHRPALRRVARIGKRVRDCMVPCDQMATLELHSKPEEVLMAVRQGAACRNRGNCASTVSSGAASNGTRARRRRKDPRVAHVGRRSGGDRGRHRGRGMTGRSPGGHPMGNENLPRRLGVSLRAK